MPENPDGKLHVLLLDRGEASLPDQCLTLSPRVALVSEDEAKACQDVHNAVEVIYGRISAERALSFPALRWVQTPGAGVDGFLTPDLIRSPILVTNASGIHAAPITEHMFGMLLARQRHLMSAWDQQKQREWKSKGLTDHLPLLEGRTLGLLGVGRIGCQSARVGRAFGMRVIGIRRGGQPHPEVDQIFPLKALHEFLSLSDVVMNTLPYTSETERIMGSREFAAMREGAVFINTGRGKTVDTDALVAAVKAGRPAAALLDVTDPEPLPADHPLWTMPGVTITPHYSGAFDDYSIHAGRIFLNNLERYLGGQPLINVVDKEAGY